VRLLERFEMAVLRGAVRDALHLPAFLREQDKQARICAAEGVDHVRYLARLTELELIDRERRMVERRIKSAKFPAAKAWIALTSRRSDLLTR